MSNIDYLILAAKALGIPPERVTQQMVEDLEYGLAFMVRSPLEYSPIQYLKAARQILHKYRKEVTSGQRFSSSS